MADIYILIDPRDDLIRYVGGTCRTAEWRFKKHLMATNAQTNCGKWIRELRSVGLKPIMQIIETVYDGLWRARERFWIANYRTVYGADLINQHAGGNGG